MVCTPLANFILLGQTSILTTTTLDIWCRTDVPRHLYVEISMDPPSDTPFWHYKRGTAVLHDTKYSWHPFATYEQSDPGDTLTHHFSIPGLMQCHTVWWTFTGKSALAWACSSTPFFKRHILYAVPPPGPQPTPIPIVIPWEERLLEPRHRRTFWANDTWYAVLANYDDISVWKLIDGSFVQQDAANRPASGANIFHDCDARVAADGLSLQISAYLHNESGSPDWIFWCPYNLATDTWAGSEQATTTITTDAVHNSCAISLDSAGVPHIAYSDNRDGVVDIYYVNRVGGGWSAPFKVGFWYGFAIAYNPSVWHDADDAFHVAAFTYVSRIGYRRRTAGGAWDAETVIQVQSGSGTHFSLMTELLIPHISHMKGVNDAAHSYGQPPTTMEVFPSEAIEVYYCMIATPSATPNLMIVYRQAPNQTWMIWKPWGFAWCGPSILDPVNSGPMCCNLADSDVISYLGYSAAPWNPTFYAFNYP